MITSDVGPLPIDQTPWEALFMSSATLGSMQRPAWSTSQAPSASSGSLNTNTGKHRRPSKRPRGFVLLGCQPLFAAVAPPPWRATAQLEPC